jgi:uncharacterized membrane-anchored protein
MKSKAKIIAIIITVLVVFFVGGMIIDKTIEFFSSPYAKNGVDLRAYLVQVSANVLTLIGWLLIVGAAFLKGHFNDVEKPKNDLLELHEKIESYEKKKRENLR